MIGYPTEHSTGKKSPQAVFCKRSILVKRLFSGYNEKAVRQTGQD